METKTQFIFSFALLLRVASRNKDNEEIRKLLVEASKTIGSDHERGRVLSATFR